MDFDDVTPMIQNVVIMDAEGKRICVKYYSDEWYACQRTVQVPRPMKRSSRNTEF
jgi:hypothetical protein